MNNYKVQYEDSKDSSIIGSLANKLFWYGLFIAGGIWFCYSYVSAY